MDPSVPDMLFVSNVDMMEDIVVVVVAGVVVDIGLNLCDEVGSRLLENLENP